MGGLSIATWCAGAYAVLLAVRALGAWRELRRQQAVPVDHDAARMRDVAVLQPILGGDPRLPDVLGATLAALPQAQFHWLVDTDDATGRWAVARLRAAHPQVAIRVHENPPAPDGTNPKTFKLDRAGEDGGAEWRDAAVDGARRTFALFAAAAEQEGVAHG